MALIRFSRGCGQSSRLISISSTQIADPNGLRERAKATKIETRLIKLWKGDPPSVTPTSTLEQNEGGLASCGGKKGT